jgi:cell division protein FtsB
MSRLGTKLVIAVFMLLFVVSAYLFAQNSALNTINNELTARINTATQTNQDLQKKLEQTTQEIEDLKNNFTSLSAVFNVDPKIETRLGVTVMEANDGQRTQYIWFTGEVENLQGKVLYDVRLMFTLTTDRGNETKYYVIGVLDPHQVMTVRHAMFASQSNRILNWSMIPVAAP